MLGQEKGLSGSHVPQCGPSPVTSATTLPRRAAILLGSGGSSVMGFHPSCDGQWWLWPLCCCWWLWHCGYPAWLYTLPPATGALGPPRCCVGSLGLLCSARFCASPGHCGREMLGQGWEPACSCTCAGVTQGASHRIILSFKALANIKTELLRCSLLWPCFAKGQHLGRHPLAQKTAEEILKLLCHPGGAFCGYSSATKKRPSHPKNGSGCSHLVKSKDSS